MSRATWAGVLVICVAAAAPAWGQVRQVIGGTNMDANMQVGSGGSNQPVPGYAPVSGNDIFYGNVAGLKYFHGNVPYSNPYQFGPRLGSSTLGNFARQSAGPPPTQVNTGQTIPYYLPSRQVSTMGGNWGVFPTGGGMDSRVAPGTSVSPLSSVGERMSPYSQSVPINAAATIRRYDALGNDITDVSPLMPSGLYGFRAPLLVSPRPIDPRDKEQQDLEKERKRQDLGKGEIIGPATQALGHIKGEVAAAVRASPEAESEVYANLQSRLALRLGKSGAVATTDPLGNSTTLPGSTGAADLLGGLGGSTAPQSSDPSKPFYVPPRTKPLTEEKTETLQSGKEVPPIETLSGPKKSVFNEYMATAERQLKEGRYVDAAATYADAGEFSPDNPLPLVGRVHAEMGAGLYSAAAVDLQVLFEKRPELIAVRYDLNKFLPQERIDYMVKDLAKLSRMRRNEHANFLVAYLDYQLDRKDDLKLQLDYWSLQDKRATWPDILRRAWLDGSSEKK